MRELKIADVTSILINTKIENYKKHAGILANTFPDKKHKTGILIKRFGGISPNIFVGIVGAARYKNRNTKKHASTWTSIFPEKKRLKRKSLQKYSCISRNIFAGIVGTA